MSKIFQREEKFYMDAFADTLGRVGAAFGQNKYLNAIKNAFQNFMPATITGAIGVLWTNVLVNSSTGLGALWKPIMALEVLNPIFSAMQYATISCITIGVTMLLAQEIANANGETGAYPALLGFILWLMVTPTSANITSLAISGVDKAGKNIGLSLTQYIDFGKIVKDFNALNPASPLTEVNGGNFSWSGIFSS